MSGDEAWVDFCSGWISGGVSVLACQPIDTVLTRMQANAGIQPAGAAGKIVPISPGTASVSIFRGMVNNFGVTSLWRGSSAMIGAVPIQNALLMTGYGAGKRWSEGSSNDSSDKNNNALIGVFVGGCVGGVFQSFVMSPVRTTFYLQSNTCLCRSTFYTIFLSSFCLHMCISYYYITYYYRLSLSK